MTSSPRQLLYLGLTLLLSAGSALAATTITYGTWDETRKDTDTALITAFQKTHPDITVKYNLVPWEVYWQKAAAMTAGGSTFDVMWMNLDNFPFYASQGALSPLDLGAGAAKMPAKLVAPYRIEGKTYGAPLGPQAVTFYINRALFRERGIKIPTSAWSWNEVVAAARKLTFKSGNRQVYGINAGDMQTDLEYGMSLYYSQGGKGLIRKTAGGYVPALDAPFAKTSQQLYDLIYKEKVSPQPTTSGSGRQGYQLFLAGQMGIYVEGSWSVGTWKQNPQLDWAFAPFPSMDGSKPRPVYSAHALVIPSASKQKAAAQTFLTWVTTSPQAQSLVAGSGLLPAQADVYKPQYLGALKNRNAETVFAQLPNSVIINDDVRTLDNLPEILTVLNQQLNLAWTGNAKLPDAIAAASKSMAGLLKVSKVIGK
jgi:multiple sugar transport system substrate-binding protein